MGNYLYSISIVLIFSNRCKKIGLNDTSALNSNARIQILNIDLIMTELNDKIMNQMKFMKSNEKYSFESFKRRDGERVKIHCVSNIDLQIQCLKNLV